MSTSRPRPVRRFFRERNVDLLSLPLDEKLFGRIVDDLNAHAGAHQPTERWMAAGGGTAGESAVRFRPECLIDAWLGFGATRITPDSLCWYYEPLRAIDWIGLLDRYFQSEYQWKSGAADLSVADLGTIFDLNVATRFLENSATDPLLVVEVGGGYGRLAEAFLNVFEGEIRYLLVDAVPSSLLYAFEYLSRCNPRLRVGSYYRGDALDWSQYDCYIAPIWHVEGISAGGYDLAINVQSMQEMDQHQVDFYLDWFDEFLKPAGIAYLCNRRDHVFRGTWNYPLCWEYLLKACTPRSWIRDFPAEVFRKGTRDFSPENAEREEAYQRELEECRRTGLRRAGARGYGAY